MDITVFGAAQDVTGSCYLVESGSTRLLVDCGLFQGSDRLERMNRIPRALTEKKIDAVLITHAHLDHCGRLPMLVKAGYKGPIYATKPTTEIIELVLKDSARIQEEDTARENRRRAIENLPPLEPLYQSKDVEHVLGLLRPITYNTAIPVAPGFSAQYVEAGHILGSSCIEMNAEQEGGTKRIVFSGDLGQWNVPIMRDPATIADADLVFMESTYGDRDHRPLDDTLNEFHSVIIEAYKNKGRVLIPSFAVGRTQILLYFLAEMFRKNMVPPFPIFLDSPMAIAATELYDKYPKFMDAEAQGLQESGQLKRDLQTLRTCSTVDESKALNTVEGPCVIIAGAGMCNAGRILHHLHQSLDDPNTSVLIVGYQPRGSLGRMMLDGAPTVKMFRETVHVRAKIHSLGGFSAHAGQTDLLRWLQPMTHDKPRVILVHGEPHPMNMLAQKIRQNFGIDPHLPKLGEVINI
jgi:metallo-beta-lactamase family protein